MPTLLLDGPGIRAWRIRFVKGTRRFAGYNFDRWHSSSEHPKTLSAILLAGGRSLRMGRDKATVVITDEPLWQRQIRVLRELRPEALWLSACVAPPWCPPEIEVVADRPPSRGPLSGVAAGLHRLQTSHLLVLAIDLPQMTAQHLRKLWGLARPGIGVIPQHDEFVEAQCAVYPAEAATAAEEVRNDQDASLHDFAHILQGRGQAHFYPLTSEERPLYLNMNTPADLPANARFGGAC